MNIFKQSFLELKSPTVTSTVKIAFPAVAAGTWIGYFAGTPLYPLWFYVVWPFLAITCLLVAIFCTFVLKNASAK